MWRLVSFIGLYVDLRHPCPIPPWAAIGGVSSVLDGPNALVWGDGRHPHIDDWNANGNIWYTYMVVRSLERMSRAGRLVWFVQYEIPAVFADQYSL